VHNSKTRACSVTEIIVFLFRVTFLLWDGKLIYLIRNIFFFDENHKNILTENHSHYNSIYTVLCYLNQVFTETFQQLIVPLRRIVLNNLCVNVLSLSRHHAHDLFKYLMTEYENFQFMFIDVVDEKIIQRIGKKLTSIRAEIKKRSHQ
jgi:hypothetical protein